MIKAVLDNNIFISAILSKGAPYQIVRIMIRGGFLSYTSLEIIAELQSTLRNKFSFPAIRADQAVSTVVFNSELVAPRQKLEIVKDDPTDNKIIECAIDAQADYVVSGDKHLLRLKKYENIEFLQANNFLLKLR